MVTRAEETWIGDAQARAERGGNGSSGSRRRGRAEATQAAAAAAPAPGAAAPPADPDEILLDYEGLARITHRRASTLRKKWRELPSPHIRELDSRGRPHRVLWLRAKIVAWVEAGEPRDIDAFEARWKRARKA